MMPGWKSRANAPATGTALSSGAEDRILKLVRRALLHSYGAESALRIAVRSGADEMLRAGATRDAMRTAISNCVTKHPGALPDKSSLVTGESRAESILARMLAWTDDVASPTVSRVAP